MQFSELKFSQKQKCVQPTLHPGKLLPNRCNILDCENSSFGKGTSEATKRIFQVGVPLWSSEPPWVFTGWELRACWGGRGAESVEKQDSHMTLPQTRLEQILGLKEAGGHLLLKWKCGRVQDSGTSVLSRKQQKNKWGHRTQVTEKMFPGTLLHPVCLALNTTFRSFSTTRGGPRPAMVDAQRSPCCLSHDPSSAPQFLILQ